MPAVWAYSVLCRFLGNLEDEAPLLPYLAGLPLHQKFNELLSCLYLPGSGMNVGCPLPTHLSKRPSHHHPSAHHSCPFTTNAKNSIIRITRFVRLIARRHVADELRQKKW